MKLSGADINIQLVCKFCLKILSRWERKFLTRTV